MELWKEKILNVYVQLVVNMIKVSRIAEGTLFEGDVSSLSEKDMQNLAHMLSALESGVKRKVKC